MDKAPTPTVLEIGQLDFTGNIIPHTWYQHLVKTVKRKSGKRTTEETSTPYLLAIIILSDICYWYRPSYIRDEATGQVIRMERKFKEDKLQRSYQQLANAFGVGKDQARDAVQWLEKEHYIKTEFKDITVRGINLNNVMYVEPIAANIAPLSMPKAPLSDVQPTPSLIDNGEPIGCTSDTNTEITPQTTPQTTTEEKTAAAAAVNPAQQRLASARAKMGSDLFTVAAAAATAQASEGAWTVPANAGGDAGAVGRAMLDAWFKGKKVDPGIVPDVVAGKFLRSMAKLAEPIEGITPDIAARAVATILDKKNRAFGYYAYTSPDVPKFKQDWTSVALQLMSGQESSQESPLVGLQALDAVLRERGIIPEVAHG